MCGDFGRNFDEIPSLPEQTAAKTQFLQCSEGKNSTKWRRPLCRHAEAAGMSSLPLFIDYSALKA
jgi:hypothetical protein